MPFVAVITGDIANSTKLPPIQLKKMIGQFKTLLAAHTLEFYRGDSFQLLVRNPPDALQVLFQLRAIARSYGQDIDVRAGIGLGTANTRVRELRTATGQAFILSGRAFDALDKSTTLHIQSSKIAANLPLQLLSDYTNFVFQQITARQAAVIQQLLAGRTQQQAAQKLKISQPTINQQARNGGWPELERILSHFKNIMDPNPIS